MHSIFKGFLIYSVSFFSLSVAWGGVVIERLEATVNNATVLKSDLDRFRRTLALRTQLDPLFNGTPIAAAGAKASDEMIREFLIEDRLIEQHFPMTEAEVEQEINSIQANNGISRAQLREAIATQGFRFEDYYELIRIGASKRNLIDREIRTKVSVSEDEIRNYYYAHYAKGKEAPRAYQVQIITQGDLSKIQSALSELRSGAEFTEVAKKFSDDASGSSSGELGTLTEEQMNPGIRKELKKLRVGETSKILGNAETRYFILRLAGITSGEDQHLKQVSEQIRAKLAASEYQRQLKLWLERQSQLAFIRRAGDSPIAGLPKGK